MHRTTPLILISIVYIISACRAKMPAEEGTSFMIDNVTIPADTVVTSAVYMSGHIICLQADGKAFVLDTAFRRDNKLTDNFAAYRFDLLKPFRDTVFLATSRQVFVLGNDLSLHLLSKPPFDDSLGFPYFGDSRYRVYACSVGEFGAAVRFLDAKTGQLYAYPATNPQQVFFFHGEYVVSSYLAHMEGFSDYLFIKDPGKLYPTRKQTACNWFIDTAMHIKIPPAGQANPAGVRYYEDSFISRTLACFPLGDSLYSIYSTDSATVLARFSGQHLVATDTLLHQGLTFYDTHPQLLPDGALTAGYATWGIIKQPDYLQPYQVAGMVWVRGHRITFVSFKVPHTPDDGD